MLLFQIRVAQYCSITAGGGDSVRPYARLLITTAIPHGATFFQGCNFIRRETPVRKRGAGVLARLWWRRLNGAGCAAKARRRRGLHDAEIFDEDVARLVMGMVGRFVGVQNWGEADIRPF